MKKEQFLEEMIDVLQTEEELSLDTVLDDLDEWDSLSKMAVMAFYNKNFGIKIALNEFKNIKTVSDLVKLAGDKID
jgi:acyl carrier protein